VEVVADLVDVVAGAAVALADVDTGAAVVGGFVVLVAEAPLDVEAGDALELAVEATVVATTAPNWVHMGLGQAPAAPCAEHQAS